MLQKICNAMSVASFVMSLMVVTAGGVMYMKRVEFMNNMMLTLQDQMIDVIQNQIKLPSKTGPALPF
tara:strand:- start:10153 stop:10353 length:201 start_codon:yes stop_codon:yes gene_type:complete